MGLKNLFFFKTSPSPPSTRTFSDSLMDENIETARAIISKWDPISPSDHTPFLHPPTAPLFSNTRQEAKQYLNTVMSLQSTMQHLLALDSSSESLVQAQFLMQLAMKRLQTEFYRILAETRDNLDPGYATSTDHRSRSVSEDDDFSEIEFRFHADSVSTVAMEDLKAIAECMVSTGYSKECVNIYILIRKSILDEALYHFGVERLSFSQVQKMDWEMLESKIKCWLNAVTITVGTLFHGERMLCDYVFGTPERKIAESCLATICREGAASLFEFPEKVAKCKKTPEKMFRTLDMYEAISVNRQQIESIFSFESTLSICSQVVVSQSRVGEAVRTMLLDFESAIQKESSKIPMPGGGIHPLTRYVMNYITFLADYADALEELVTDSQKNPLPESYYRSPDCEGKNRSSKIAERIAWLILVLLCKLDGKAELYKEGALSYLFLANNMQYVVVKVRNSNLGFILGDDWLAKHELKVKEYVSKYERVGWSKVFASLPDNPTAEQLRAIFDNFNVEFHEACREMLDKYPVGSETIFGFSPDVLENDTSEILSGSVSSHIPSPPHHFKRPMM